MKSVLLSLFFFLPVITLAQDNNSFQWMAQLLATNARYKTPIPWEGSQRLQTELSLSIAAARDSTQKSELLEQKAISSLKHGNYGQAFADFEEAALLNSKRRGVVGWRYLFFLRDYSRALNHLTAFDALTPNFDDPIDDYSVNYLKGRAFAGLRQYEQATEAYTIAISNRETHYGSEWVDYRYFIARAVSYLALNQYSKALIDLDKALRNSPKSTMAHYHRGRVLQELGRTTEAIDAFRDALFFVRSQPFERDYYYEQPDAAYEGQIETVLKMLKN